MSANAPLSGSTKTEMTRTQRELVNSCWEETQYDAGIAILDQLRTSRYRPSVDHIRQLVFISLHSSTPKIPNPIDVQASPSKLTKRERFQLLPKTVIAARRLLTSFSLTNTPEGLFHAIPSWDNDLSRTEVEEESVLAKESTRVNRVKTCWDLLKSDFINSVAASAPSRKGQRRRSSRRNADSDQDEEGEDTNRVVGDDAWATLEWIITIFEKQERLVPSGEPRYSSLFLATIPPERSGKTARWDFNRPLEIALHALRRDDEAQRKLGMRLLELLVNLSSTIHLDFPLFVDNMFNTLSSSPRALVLDMMSLLPPSSPVLRFKISLCQRLLAPKTSVVQSRPAVRPRAQLKPRDSATNVVATANVPAAPVITRKFTGPAAQEVVQLVTSPMKSDTLPILRLRFELMLAYHLVQSQIPANDRDQEWQLKRGNGELEKILVDNFESEGTEGPLYHRMLQSMICVK